MLPEPEKPLPQEIGIEEQLLLKEMVSSIFIHQYSILNGYLGLSVPYYYGDGSDSKFKVIIMKDMMIMENTEILYIGKIKL